MDLTLALDLGTTSTRAVIFDEKNNIVCSHSEPIKLNSPKPGFEEQDPMKLVDKTILCVQTCLKNAKITAADIAAMGITNQRETVVAWDSKTGQPFCPAIVWKDSRTQDWCKKHKADYDKAQLQQINGCPLSPYFSATKIRWLLDHCGYKKPLIGTLDCFLLWHLTGGKTFATDITNASRTALLDCKNGQWSEACLSFFNIPSGLLPNIMKSADDFGETDPALFDGPIAIRGILGDQQAALLGQNCTQAGMVKCTYGTGSFLMMNTESEFLPQDNLIATVAYEVGDTRHYTLEGGGFSANSMLHWLRNNFQLYQKTDEIDALVETTDNNMGVYIIPAFSGLGAPYWVDTIGAEIGGLTLATKGKHILRATLEAIANQSLDICNAMQAQSIPHIGIDGGVSNNNWICQYLADLVDAPVIRPTGGQWMTALGAAQIARLGAKKITLNKLATSTEDCITFAPSSKQPDNQNTYSKWKAQVTRYCNSHHP